MEFFYILSMFTCKFLMDLVVLIIFILTVHWDVATGRNGLYLCHSILAHICFTKGNTQYLSLANFISVVLWFHLKRFLSSTTACRWYFTFHLGFHCGYWRCRSCLQVIQFSLWKEYGKAHCFPFWFVFIKCCFLTF